MFVIIWASNKPENKGCLTKGQAVQWIVADTGHPGTQ